MKKIQQKIVLLVDLENISWGFGQRMFRPEKFSMEAGFDHLIEWLKQFGDVVMVCIFVPDHFIETGKLTKETRQFFQKRGFFTILCSKDENKDTADFNMIKYGLEVLLPYIAGVTHLCIGSGDIDFSELCLEAKKKGLKIMVTTGSIKSFSKDLARIVDTNPDTGRKMVHLFTPVNN